MFVASQLGYDTPKKVNPAGDTYLTPTYSYLESPPLISVVMTPLQFEYGPNLCKGWLRFQGLSRCTLSLWKFQTLSGCEPYFPIALWNNNPPYYPPLKSVTSQFSPTEVWGDVHVLFQHGKVSRAMGEKEFVDWEIEHVTLRWLVEGRFFFWLMLSRLADTSLRAWVSTSGRRERGRKRGRKRGREGEREGEQPSEGEFLQSDWAILMII